MSTTAPLATAPDLAAAKATAAETAKKKLSSPWASVAAIVIAVLWTLPTFGLLVSSFRPERAIKRTGWWTFFSDPTTTFENYSKVFGEEGIGHVRINVGCAPDVLREAIARIGALADDGGRGIRDRIGQTSARPVRQ